MDNDRRSAGAAPLVLVLLAAGFNAWAFFPEVLHPTAHMSDVAFHLSILKALDENVRAGGSWFDFWYDKSPFGYPLFRTYQHLPHLILYAVHRLSGLPLESLLRFSTFAFATLLPAAFFTGARWFGVSPLAAGLAAFSGSLMSEAGDYGIGMHNFTWGSGGIITQLWAAVFLIPALGAVYRYLNAGEGLPAAACLGFLAAGSHFVAAAVLGVSFILFLLSALPAGRKLLPRAAAMIALGTLSTAYQWYFIAADRTFQHASPYEPDWKFLGHGANWVWRNFWNGDLFDFQRFPSLSLAVLAGLAAAVFLRRDRVSITLCASLLFWLAILGIQGMTGETLRDVPIIGNFHFHRLILAVEVFGAMLAACGLETFLQLASSPRRQIIAACLITGLLVPPFMERAARYERAHEWLGNALDAQAKDVDLRALVSYLQSHPGGWIHPGMEMNWSSRLLVGSYMALRHVLLGEGLPVAGQLYHSNGLSGDVLFRFNPYRESHYRILNMRYTVSPEGWNPPPFLSPVRQFGRYRLYEYKESAPFTLQLPVYRLDESSTRRLSPLIQAWFDSPMVERGQAGVIDSPGFPTAALSEIPQGALTSWQKTGPAEYHAEVDLATPVLLTLAQGFHPNWEAWADGEKTSTVRVTPDFVSIPLPRGRHSVTFRYRPSQAAPWLFFLGTLILFPLSRLCQKHLH